MFNTYLGQDQVRINWKYTTSSGNASMAVSTMFYTGKKYAFWHYGLSRSPRNIFAK